MRTLDEPSPISCAVWQECYWRWSALKESVVRRSLDLLSPDGQNGFKPVGDRTMSPEVKCHNGSSGLAVMLKFTFF